MKILVVSDSHGDFNTLKKIVLTSEPFDLLVHLGDGIQEGIQLQKMKGFNFLAVSGNNDPPGLFPLSLTLKLCNQRCFFTHGDQYQVHDNLQILLHAAQNEAAAWVFYGHTHCFHDEVLKGIHMLNPGPAAFHLTKEPSYLIINMNDGQLQVSKTHIKIHDNSIENDSLI